MSNRIYEFRIRRVSRACEPGLDLERVTGSGAAARIFAHMLREEPREVFVTLHLDVQNRAIGYERIAVGTMMGVEVHPRELFRGAILSGAAAIIAGHNHPSGDPAPSISDNALTKRLADAGELLGIPVHDHVIVATPPIAGTPAYYSYNERGLL